MIEFLLNQEKHSVSDIDPCTTVLDYLRNDLGLCGTKEGCASGDCGACTVLVGELSEDELSYKAQNACLMLLPTLQGKQLITVEHLSQDEVLHQVQQSMVDNHGSQCGFCTPGIVMSLVGLFKRTSSPSKQQITESLGGNLCRCTGYRPIIRAAEQVAEQLEPDQFDKSRNETILALQALQKTGIHEAHGENYHYFSPTTLDELADLYSKKPDAYLVAGGTDLALEITQALKSLDPLIYLGNVKALRGVNDEGDAITIAAGTPLSDCMPVVTEYFPDFGDVLLRFGSEQIRNVGTMGGNLANASPVGDTAPALLALNATITLRNGGQRRSVAVDEFFVSYKKTILAPGEFIEKISIPKLSPSQTFRMYKVSKRFEDDISAVCGAFCIEVENSVIVGARLAYGGMAEMPKRAVLCEKALVQKPWTMATILAACAALQQDFQPISDIRASAEYRMTIAQNLLKKYFAESQSDKRIGVVDHV